MVETLEVSNVLERMNPFIRSHFRRYEGRKSRATSRGNQTLIIAEDLEEKRSDPSQQVQKHYFNGVNNITCPASTAVCE